MGVQSRTDIMFRDPDSPGKMGPRHGLIGLDKRRHYPWGSAVALLSSVSGSESSSQQAELSSDTPLRTPKEGGTSQWLRSVPAWLGPGGQAVASFTPPQCPPHVSGEPEGLTGQRPSPHQDQGWAGVCRSLAEPQAPHRLSMTPEEHRAFWRDVQFTVDKDVVRTDRSNQFFRGEDNPNVESMRYAFPASGLLPVGRTALRPPPPPHLPLWVTSPHGPPPPATCEGAG